MLRRYVIKDHAKMLKTTVSQIIKELTEPPGSSGVILAMKLNVENDIMVNKLN